MGLMDCSAERTQTAALAGDEEAFGRLVAPAVGPGFRLAFGMLQDRAEAEDAVQEAVLKAWRKLGSFRAEADFTAWFLAIVANQCRTVRRGRWWAVVRHAEPPELPAPDAGSAPADHDLRRALSRLDADRRLIVVLHYYLDMGLEDVAAVVGVPVGTVKSRLHRALGALRLDSALQGDIA